MARKVDSTFYTTINWIETRKAYLHSVSGLCERCLARGLIVPASDVHHKIRLTPENIDDPAVTLNWANLEALCAACHHKEHEHRPRERLWRTDENGHVEL